MVRRMHVKVLNIYFFGVAQTVPATFRSHIQNITSPEETAFGVLALMNDLAEEALGTNKLYSNGNRTLNNGNGTIYGLVQCSRDLNHRECSKCLKILVNKVNDGCQESTGFRIFNPSCDLTYANSSFIEQLQVLPPSSQPVPPPSPRPTPIPQSLLPQSGNSEIVDFFFHPNKKKARQFYLNILALLKFRHTANFYLP